MENVKDIVDTLKELYLALNNIKAMIDNTIEVQVSRQLQSAMVKCGNVINNLSSEQKVPDAIVANKNNQTPSTE